MSLNYSRTLGASLASAVWVALLSGSVFAANTELVDAIKEEVAVTTTDLTFQEFTSCDQMESVLTDFIDENREYFYQPIYYRTFSPEIMMIDSVAEDTSADFAVAGASAKTIESSSNEYSTTNIQKVNIDEPDIYKTDGDTLYYYSQEQETIYLIQSPLDRETQTITLENADIISEIAVPDSLYNIDLFIYEDELIILGQRYSDHISSSLLNRGQRSVVARYDVSSTDTPSLTSYTEIDGYLEDLRLNLDTGILYVITSTSINWYGYFEMIDNNKEVSLTSMLPSNISLEITPNNGVLTQRNIPWCDDINYIFPTQETLSQLRQWPAFTTITAIDLDDDTQTSNVLFGHAGEVHMSQEGLYFAQWIYTPSNFSCPINARCAGLWFPSGERQTLIHGFAVDAQDIDYSGSTLIPGSPLNDQYSMDENDGYFRILTSTRSPSQNTHLSILDEDLNIHGQLLNIQEDERFQWSRFIDEKLYLITFEQIDPLFVIDLEDQANPTIIGELKMPGYSNYLHPLGEEVDGIQYLLGIGYDTGTNERGWTQNLWVKVDMYKIDYNNQETADSLCGKLANEDEETYDSCLSSVDTSRILVEQVDSLVYGDKGSYTPVAQNPRLFVMNSNNELLLPLLTKELSDSIENCTVTYQNGEEVSKRCYTNEEYITNFAGYKTIELDTEQETISEVGSTDYQTQLQEYARWSGDNLYSYIFDQLAIRVAFMGDVTAFFTNYFVDFSLDTTTYSDSYTLELD